MDHVDECSCVGYAVSYFDLLSELWENSQIQISFKHYSFIVIIICFFSYKLLIRSTFCMNLMLQWSIFHFVFLYEVEFLLSCWLRQCWSSDMLTYFIVHFSSEKIDWSWIKQSAASQTRFLKNKCVFKQSICPWQCQ